MLLVNVLVNKGGITMDLKIVGWDDFDSNYPMKQLTQEELVYVLKLLKEEIIKNGYCIRFFFFLLEKRSIIY